MIRYLYDRILAAADSPNALWILAGVSFVESSVFPITPLVLLAPMVLARPDRAWLIAGVCTVASVAGGVAGYYIGVFFYEEVGKPVLELYGKADAFEEISQRFREFGAEAVLFAAVSPFPYKVVTIASGVAELSLWVLIGASIVGRGMQFFFVAAVLWKFGEPAKALIDRHFMLITTLTALLIVAGFVAVRVLL